MRSQESNYMFSSFTKSTIKNQNTKFTEKSAGITIRMFPDYPIEKSQYPINKKISGYYPIHQNFLSGALYYTISDLCWDEYAVLLTCNLYTDNDVSKGQ